MWLLLTTCSNNNYSLLHVGAVKMLVVVLRVSKGCYSKSASLDAGHVQVGSSHTAGATIAMLSFPT